MNPAHHETIRTMIDQTLKSLGLTVDQITVDIDEKTNSTRFVVVSPESGLLIGEHGARLLALNHLIKKMVEQQIEDVVTNFMVDVNDYQKKRVDDLRAKAHILAERARYFRSSIEMDPMSSYERMIIHSEFVNVPDIKTESQGVGKERRVILRFTETPAS